MISVITAPGDLVVARSHGIDVRFGGVEVTSAVSGNPTSMKPEAGLLVRLEGVRNQETKRRDQSFLEALHQWVEMRKKHGPESAGDVPIMPGVLALEPIGTIISDDSGTEYRCVSGQIAGDGTEWSASWAFLPAPPQHARLRLQFTIDGEPTGMDCQIAIG
jgi:hypothetical protein